VPEPYRIIFSKRVANDLEAIFRHIAKESPQNAPQVVDRILTAIAGLKTFPHRTVLEGQPTRLKYPVRSLPVLSYLVFFRVIEAEHVVRILQVRHGARRRPKRF
jgi:toxin ParE1/3/4